MRRDALIVGINHYKYLPDLKAPALDAEAIAQRLGEDGDFNTLYRLPERITWYSHNEMSKRKNISRHQIENLQRVAVPMNLTGIIFSDST